MPKRQLNMILLPPNKVFTVTNSVQSPRHHTLGPDLQLAELSSFQTREARTTWHLTWLYRVAQGITVSEFCSDSSLSNNIVLAYELSSQLAAVGHVEGTALLLAITASHTPWRWLPCAEDNLYYQSTIYAGKLSRRITLRVQSTIHPSTRPASTLSSLWSGVRRMVVSQVRSRSLLEHAAAKPATSTGVCGLTRKVKM